MTHRETLIALVKSTSGSSTKLARLLGVSPQRADQLLHPEKHRARVMVDQSLKPERCQICHTKTKDLEAHHYNYHHPERIIWGCVICHNIIG